MDKHGMEKRYGEWKRNLLPLPHEITFEGDVECRPEKVSIVVRPDAGAIERQAAATLECLFAADAAPGVAADAFEIAIGVVDSGPDADRLRGLPNCGQAYAIRPEGRKRLVLAALSEPGISYAARTLRQLLEPMLAPGSVRVPLVSVTDWPEMAERGMWNFPTPREWIPWMASMKLNYGKMDSTELSTVVRGKPNSARIDSALMEKARVIGFNYVPLITHLNFLHDRGLYRAYPELAGKGDGALAGRYFAHKEGNRHRAPCASNPVLVDILAEWIADIASQGASEVGCWLTERPAQCECDDCTAQGQFVLEARAFVNAWKRIRPRFPEFNLRIFLSTTTSERDYRVLAELPPEVKVGRACATEMERVLNLPRDLTANPLLDYHASQGRWIASYDVPVNANGRVETPEFKVPQSSAHRIRDYVGQLIRRQYSGAYGMMAWVPLGKETCGFNVAALAEYSWNLNGRSEKEFAIAWATREGYADAEAFGEWSERIGPVAFDVYDSDFPVCYSWGKAAEMIRRKQRPFLGEGMFRYYEQVEDFEKKVDACRQAMRIASEFESQDHANETRVVMTYVELARCIYHVAEQAATRDLADPGVQAQLHAALESLESAGGDNVAAIRNWREALGPEPWHYRVHDAIRGTKMTVSEIVRFLRERYFH